MVIRPLVWQDKDKIRQLLEQRGTFNKKEIEVAVELVNEALRFPERDEYCVACAIDPTDSLAGYICFGPIPMADDCYDLYWIATHKEHMNRGIGGTLLQETEEAIKKAGGFGIYVETSSKEQYFPTRAFYEKNGYILKARFENFYDEVDDKCVYVKYL